MNKDTFVATDRVFKDFTERSEAFKKRAEALNVASRKERQLRNLVNGGAMALTAFVLSVYLGGSWMSTKGFVAGLVAVFVARWVTNLIVSMVWTDPLMKRIDAECPAPPREP
jgi:hypothetical protein